MGWCGRKPACYSEGFRCDRFCFNKLSGYLDLGTVSHVHKYLPDHPSPWLTDFFWTLGRKSTSAILYWVWQPRTSLHLFNFLQHNVHQHTGQRLSKAESFGTSWNLYPIEMFQSFTTFWCQARGRFYNKLHILSTVFFLKVFLFLSTPFWIALMYDDVIYHLFSKIVWLVYFWDSYLQDWNWQEWNVDRFNQYCWMTFIFNIKKGYHLCIFSKSHTK